MLKNRFVSEFRPPGIVSAVLAVLLLAFIATPATATSQPLPDAPSVNNHEGGQPAIGTPTDALFMSVGNAADNSQLFVSLSTTDGGKALVSATTNFNNGNDNKSINGTTELQPQIFVSLNTTPDPGGSFCISWRDYDQANVVSHQAALPADTPNCAMNKARADANSPATHHLLE